MLSLKNRAFSATILALGVSAGIVAWQLYNAAQHQALFVDFRAFYCAGSAVDLHVNPYLASALLPCEQQPQPLGLYSVAVALVAPFPGYALAAFSPLAFFTYSYAAAVWLIVSLAATLCACVLFARITGGRALATLALLVVGLAVAVLPYGQLAPLILCGLCFTALALRLDSASGTLIGLSLTALEPNVALPVFAAVFFWRREMRSGVLGLCALLLLAHIAVLGFSESVAYFTEILPAHAASEIAFVNQFSLTWALQAAGAMSPIALMLGNASYAIMGGLGVWLSGNVARAQKDASFIALVPAALAVTGGPYVHYGEVLLALPAAALLFLKLRDVSQAFAGAAVVLIAIPWLWVVTQPVNVIFAVVAAAAVSRYVLHADGMSSLRITVGAALLCGIILITAFHFGPQLEVRHYVASNASLADTARGAQIAMSGSSFGIVWWIAKLPTWVGLLLLFGAAVRSQRQFAVAGNTV